MAVDNAVTRRLFFAFDLDEATRAAIAALVDRLRQRLESDLARDRGRIKWVERENLHLTVRFLGATTDAKWQELRVVMQQPLTLAPFELRFDRVGTFPERGAPRVVWVGVSAGAVEASRVCNELDQRLSTIGIPPETRPFHAHLTLGRFRDVASRGTSRTLREVVVDSLEAVLVDHVTLYESELTPGGPRYVPLLRVGFRSDVAA